MSTIDLAKYADHLPQWVMESTEDSGFGVVTAARKDKTGAVKVTFSRWDEAIYFYKKYEIHKSKETPAGYYGHWRTEGRRNPWAGTLTEVIRQLDMQIQRQRHDAQLQAIEVTTQD